MLAGSITRRVRGRWFGRCPRLRFEGRLAGAPSPLQGSTRLLLCRLQNALGELDILEGQIELLGVELLGPLAELLALKLTDDAFQPPLRLHRIRKRRLGLGKARLQDSVLFGQGGVGHDKDHAHGPWGRHDQSSAESFRRSYPASSGRRTRSGRTSRQSSPSNSAESWAGDIFITPSCTWGQTNFASSRRL